MTPEQRQGIEKLIALKLACIDISNNECGGGSGRLAHEFVGVKQTLAILGYDLKADVNPYFYKDRKASTFTLEEI